MREKVCDEKKCTGCYACINKCPRNCISMEQNVIGNAVPLIDEKKCVGCNMCEKVCPVINPPSLSAPLYTYAAYAKDRELHIKAASGGVASVLARSIIRSGGVVYGCSQIKGLEFGHIRVDNESELIRLRGSKYTHSHIGNAFSLVKEDLDNSRLVLFVGTPCQIAGLKNYLGGANQELLYCVDLICHGVPDQNTFVEAMKQECNSYDFDNYTLTFRDEKGFKIKIRDKEGKVIHERNLKNSYYYNGFIEGYIYRHNCYSCHYATEKRIGDITLGDFWGLGNESPFSGDKSNGINVVLVNSAKGEALFNANTNEFDVWERSIEEAVKGNGQLRAPMNYSKAAKRFEIIASKRGIKTALVKCNPSKRIALKARETINSNPLLRSIVSKISFLSKKL